MIVIYICMKCMSRMKSYSRVTVHNVCAVQNVAAAGYFQQDAKICIGRYRSFEDNKEVPNNYKEDDKANGTRLCYMICIIIGRS